MVTFIRMGGVYIGNINFICRTKQTSVVAFSLVRRGDVSGEIEGTTKAFIFGGQSYYGAENDTDEYEPDTWTSKTSMPGSLYGNAATTLNGYVYVCAGEDGNTKTKVNWEYYTDTWTSKTEMPSPTRHDLIAFALLNKGYYEGGITYGSVILGDNDEYDPDSWTSKTNGPAARDHAGSAINDKGYVYYSQHTSEYTPGLDGWATKTNMPSPSRSGHAAATVNDKGYVFGGYGTSFMTDCDEYDPDSWSSKTSMPSPGRREFDAAEIFNKAYVFCGDSGSSFKMDDCDRYEPDIDTWTSMTSAPAPPREEEAAASL